MSGDGEIWLVAELASEPSFDEVASGCPGCGQPLDHLALILDIEGGDPLACRECGAVLAA